MEDISSTIPFPEDMTVGESVVHEFEDFLNVWVS